MSVPATNDRSGWQRFIEMKVLECYFLCVKNYINLHASRRSMALTGIKNIFL